MRLFKRFPRLRPRLQEDQSIVPPDDRSRYQAFAADFETLDRELMPQFRELDNQALQKQNWHRLMYVILICGSALMTILGIVQLAFINVVGIGLAGAIVAAFPVAATSFSQTFRYQEQYLNARLAAERLRGEYFLFLGHIGPYADEQDRVQKLVQQVHDIKKQGGIV